VGIIGTPLASKELMVVLMEISIFPNATKRCKLMVSALDALKKLEGQIVIAARC
jgi:hypothetical protein